MISVYDVLYKVIDFVSRSMPYQLFQGQTLPSRRDIERSIRRMFEEHFTKPTQLQISDVQTLGRGVHRIAYEVNISLRPDEFNLAGRYVLLYPYEEEAAGLQTRLLREIDALVALTQSTPLFRYPQIIGNSIMDDAIVILEKKVEGVPIDLRAGRCMVGQPWDVAGEIAARVHELNDVALALDGYATRRAHAIESIKSLDGHEHSIFKEAKAWCMEHLPPPNVPSTLLHGDLSGQNILVDIAGKQAPALIDWTFTLRGDPAHELAIITQGKRRPFEVDDGHERLLNAYVDAGGPELSVNDIYLYEFCLFGRRYTAATTRGRQRIESPQEPLRLLHNLLVRLTKKSHP